MSLVSLNNDWKQFSNGKKWRLRLVDDGLCEIETDDNCPNYIKSYASILPKMRKVKSFYTGKVEFGQLDQHGNAIDILVANAMTESYGSVPTPFSASELKTVFNRATGQDTGTRLAQVVNYVRDREKFLIRKEPGYINPIATPHRISIGAHHMLISTALDLLPGHAPKGSLAYENKIADFIYKAISSSPFAAQLAVNYFNRKFSKHQNELPLLAATYNAGSPRRTSRNPWNLVQYGEHIDRWISYYNTSRLLDQAARSNKETIALTVKRAFFTEESTIGRLYVNEQFHCYTLEDRYRSTGKKVYGKTAIPEGRYEVIVNLSNRFKKRMPLLLEVPNFKGVRIHKGNTAVDTLGCILVGKNKGPDRIWDCSGVYNSLLAQLETAHKKGKVYLTIEKG